MSITSELARLDATSTALGYPCSIIYANFVPGEEWVNKVQSNTTANIQRMVYDIRVQTADEMVNNWCGDGVIHIDCGLACAGRKPSDAQDRLEAWVKALGFVTPGGNIGYAPVRPYVLRDGLAEELVMWQCEPQDGTFPYQPLPVAPNNGIWVASVQMNMAWVMA